MLEGHRATTDKEGELYCKEFIPDIAGTYKGTCVIIGSGKDMWQDYDKIKDKGFDLMGINVGGQFVPKLTHLFSWHAKQISAIATFRKAEFFGEEFITHSVRPHPGIDYVWYLSGGASMSGISAIDLCVLLGYENIILCGVPMDDSGYFYGRPKNPDICDKYRNEEVIRLKNKFGDRVKSLSGYTKEIFGYPNITRTSNPYVPISNNDETTLDKLLKDRVEILEIGCGRSTETLLKHGNVTIVDISKDRTDRFKDKATVTDIASINKKFDFIFIDGNHEYINIKKDIENCFPLLKGGGIICGHDYESTEYDERYIHNDAVEGRHNGVIKAVNDFFKNKAAKLPDRIWAYKGDNNGSI